MLRAVIFDFDGVILDTETPEYEALGELYAAHGQTLPLEKWLLAVGTFGGFDPYVYLEQLVGSRLDRNALRARRRARMAELMATHQPMPGVLSRLAEAAGAGLKLAIASSSDANWVLPKLKTYGIDHYFEAIVCASVEGLPAKPDPAVYAEALRALGVPASEAIAIEDSSNGVAAARAAGLACVAVPNLVTSGMDFSAASLCIDSLEAITLREMASRVGIGALLE